MGEHYRAAPDFKCHAPSRAFRRLLEALQYARDAADAFGVGYAVWHVAGGRLWLVHRYRAGQRRG
jgi:hypothetical protein